MIKFILLFLLTLPLFALNTLAVDSYESNFALVCNIKKSKTLGFLNESLYLSSADFKQKYKYCSIVNMQLVSYVLAKTKLVEKTVNNDGFMIQRKEFVILKDGESKYMYYWFVVTEEVAK